MFYSPTSTLDLITLIVITDMKSCHLAILRRSHCNLIRSMKIVELYSNQTIITLADPKFELSFFKF